MKYKCYVITAFVWADTKMNQPKTKITENDVRKSKPAFHLTGGLLPASIISYFAHLKVKK